MSTLQYHLLSQSSYLQQLLNFLKPLEEQPLSKIANLSNTTARGLQPEYDSGTNLAIGYGYDLFATPFSTILNQFNQVGVTFADPEGVKAALQED